MEIEIVPTGESSCSTKTSPASLRVLVVDADATCLKLTRTMLKTCKYEVVAIQRAMEALSILRERQGEFDLVLMDIHIPDMDAISLLENIRDEFKVPIIMMSDDNKEPVVRRCLRSGASFCLLKPPSMNEIKNLWQYVFLKRSCRWEESPPEESAGSASSVNGKQQGSKRKAHRGNDSDEDKVHVVIHKKSRMVWNNELHDQFLNAIDQLGLDRAVPTKILRVMNVPGLTRENISSHLQKYRGFLRQAKSSMETSFPWSMAGGTLSSSFPVSRPSLMDLQEGFPQSPKKQFTHTAFQSGLGGTVQDHMPFLSQETSSSNSMPELRYGQSFPMNNQGNLQQSLNNQGILQQPLFGTGSNLNNQGSIAGYPKFGVQPHNTRMSSCLNGNISSGLVRLAHFGNDPLDHSISKLELHAHNNIPSFRNAESFRNVNQPPYFNCVNDTYSGTQVTSTGELVGLNQMGDIDVNIQNNDNSSFNHREEIHRGKMPIIAVGNSLDLPKCSSVNYGNVTREVASSSVIQQQPSPPPLRQPQPPPPLQEEEENTLGDGVLFDTDSLLDFQNYSCTFENSSPPPQLHVYHAKLPNAISMHAC